MTGRRRTGITLPALVISGALLTLLVACLEAADGAGEGPRTPAPEFDLPLLDGGHLQLGAHRGKVVILDFWATWCAPCEVQMPVLDTLWKEAGGDDLMVIGVSVDTDPAADVTEWVAERGFEYPIVMGDQQLAMEYGVIGFPSLIIVDANGGIYTRHTGVWSRPEIEDVLARVRSETPAPL